MPVTPRPRATVLGAFLEGWRRALGAPAVTASLLAATWFLAQPLALAFRAALEADVGSTPGSEIVLADESEIAAMRARALGRLIEGELGFFGSPAAVSDWLRHDPLNPVLAGTAGACAALWLFVTGGVLDRFARGRPIYTAAFFAACGVYFVRFIRLAVVIGAAYFILFRWLYPLLFETIYGLWTNDPTTDRGLWVRGGLYGVFAAALVVVGAVADFAKVRAVVEDRRGMLGAIAASVRFIRRRPLRVFALYLLNLFAWIVILRLWVQAEPGADAPSWLALLLVLLYLVARIWARLAFMASEVVFFQGELAHADYTAAPLPVWPDSPEAEAMENLKAEGRRP